MTEPSLSMQAAIRARLVATSAVTSLVPATNIMDRNKTPEVFPCILIGEGQTVPDEGLARRRHHVFSDLHIWATEPGLVVSKQIAGAVRDALADTFWNVTGLHVADLHIASSRFIRDPGGLRSHGIVTLQASVSEVAP
ncbi:DUF3168 domain-containing protein [Nitratireductor sp. StC3]|uniref:DUF3168 domain-containing protein n=1 Tax=Nitratireductor sp. StC3 TaxID=2126741 RepID=UPI000D0E2924|nr:DUF3168 domain-containing protein [Nitratireductor sp. StC3]PSM16116.1 DUF3168 domain-containing protein [Nitratireductor sp. StC3]